MELYKQILIRLLADEKIDVTFANVTLDINRIVKDICYQALCEIKAVVENDDLDDEECFMRIEKIVHIYESLGSDGGTRHDFG